MAYIYHIQKINVVYIKHLIYNHTIYLIYTTFIEQIMDMQELGNLIATTRKKLKLTQADLAQQAAIGRVTLSLIENNKIAEIGITKIIRLCELLSLEFTVRPKSARPTLQQLLAEKNHHG